VKTRFLVMSCLLAVLPVVSAYSQSMGPVKADIPFQFTAAGKVYPAGEYTFSRGNGPVKESFIIRGPGGVSGLVTILTRTAGGIHTTPQDAHVVFDVMGDTNFLSEIWIPGDDGYVLHITKEKHTHRIVNVPR
jgi:hypothetical protein